MHRTSLLEKLETYRAIDDEDIKTKNKLIEFIRREPHCFERTLLEGHITGSAWLLDPSRKKTLLTHHRKLGKWLQLGGHADGNPNIQEVAIREAIEESGIDKISLVYENVFDIDIHLIPARKDEPEHYHYDVRFLLQAGKTEFAVSDESHSLSWIPLDELEKYTTEWSVLRMKEKLSNRA